MDNEEHPGAGKRSGPKPTNSSLGEYLFYMAREEPERGVVIVSPDRKIATLADIALMGAGPDVNLFRCEWTDHGTDYAVILWRGLARIAIPFSDDEPLKVIVASDDFSRRALGYELLVDRFGPAEPRDGSSPPPPWPSRPEQ